MTFNVKHKIVGIANLLKVVIAVHENINKLTSFPMRLKMVSVISTIWMRWISIKLSLSPTGD